MSLPCPSEHSVSGDKVTAVWSCRPGSRDPLQTVFAGWVAYTCLQNSIGWKTYDLNEFDLKAIYNFKFPKIPSSYPRNPPTRYQTTSKAPPQILQTSPNKSSKHLRKLYLKNQKPNIWPEIQICFHTILYVYSKVSKTLDFYQMGFLIRGLFNTWNV